MKRAAPDALMTDAVINVAQLVKHYGPVQALAGLDFSVSQGEIFGLIGPDGAGKTTAFGILAGVMEPTGGSVTLFGQPPREARLNLGYLTQQFSLYKDLSIEENMRYSAGLKRVSEADFAVRSQDLLQRLGLLSFAHRLASQLSGGMKQKLALCCALVGQPQVLLLDEPTTGVDPVSRREFWDLLAAFAAEGITIVVATPYLDEAERCHRIGLIYDGQLQQQGSLSELRDSLGLQRLELRAADLSAAEQALLSDGTVSDGTVGDGTVSDGTVSDGTVSDGTVSDATVGKADANSRGHSSTIADIQTFGDRLDVLVSDLAAGEPQIRDRLSQAGIALHSLRPGAVTLENVFVNRLRQQGSDPPYLPFPAYRPGPASGSIAIATEDLTKIFGDFQAVRKLTLTLHYGEIYGLLGANGAGKTTTIKMLCGLLPASGGQIQLAGARHQINRPAVRSRLGYMSQKFTLYDDLTIAQNLAFYCGVYGVPRTLRPEKIRWVLETCGLLGREHTLTGSLPEGWKKRVSFGACVMHEPDILFLDEPTSGVDPLARRQFWRLIREFARRGTAILVTTHYLEEAENCHHMALMAAGEIVAQGSPSAIKAAQRGQLIELALSPLQAASDLLKSSLEPWRVSIFGDRLHLVLDHPETELPQVQQQLAAAHIQIYSQQSLPFSLEDAFIGIVQRAGQRPQSPVTKVSHQS